MCIHVGVLVSFSVVMTVMLGQRCFDSLSKHKHVLQNFNGIAMSGVENKKGGGVP